MQYSIKGINLTEQFEGLSLSAYADPTGTLTIGYGHTGSDVTKGLVWTQNQCQLALIRDIQIAEDAVNKYVTVVINQNQFDALVDFTFNAGVNSFKTSSLLKYINKDDMKNADLEFGKWIHSKGTVLPGLVKRRLAEANLFKS